MSGIRAQRAILSAEFFWFGGFLSAPKVYDGGTSFSAHPTLRHSGESAAPADAAEGDGVLRYVCVDGDWSVDFSAI